MEDTKNEIFLKVRKIISEVLNLDESKIDNKSKLVDDLGAESLDIITLLIEFEDKFNRKIPEEEAQKIVYVSDIVDYIEQKV